ncbi:MAG: DUF4864 domain-containing protein [Candidatus Puniceispirillales bacterium]|jgi:hypothetical protein|tara:strand:- start:5 stop:460 length:456 start_codon:yes stop_codon:yes gene_type:complete
MKNIIVLSILLFFSKISFADNLVKPSPDINPIDVVEVQLFALQSNDETDFGIRQTWEFAHPRNKMATGPLPRFTSMIKTPAYSILLNNLKFETKEIFNDGKTAGIAVRIEAKDNKAYTYMWTLEKIIEEGPLNGNWMTSGVSSPRLLAEGS